MDRDVAVTFIEDVPGTVKGQIIGRFLRALTELNQDVLVDASSVPRLFGTDADSDTLAEAYERLPAKDRAKIERVKILEDAA